MGIIEARRTLKKWQKKMGLLDFSITMEMGHVTKGDLASCDIESEEHRAHITLSKKRKKELTEELVVHELLHVLVYRLWSYVEVVIQRISKDALSRRTLEAEYELLEEELVNRLARSLVKTRASRPGLKRH